MTKRLTISAERWAEFIATVRGKACPPLRDFKADRGCRAWEQSEQDGFLPPDWEAMCDGCWNDWFEVQEVDL